MRELLRHNNAAEVTQIRLCIDRLKEYGFSMGSKFPQSIRKVSDEVWELRPGGSRVFFFHYTGKTIVLLHAYKKQSQKAPQGEIEQAEKEMKDYKRRHQNEG